MSAVFDSIAAEYKKTRMLPFRRYVESYTYLSTIGDLTGKTILDLACGEGIYSREFKRSGAARVVGVDVSESMIALARQEEAREPLGIEYIVEDAWKLGRLGEFDLVLASYLLNYSRTEEKLQELCAVIIANLLPGGRFVTVNNNPGQALETFEAIKKYGFTKRLRTPPLRAGSVIAIQFEVEGREFAFENYYLSVECHERALRSAGFQAVRWQPLVLSPEGARDQGEEFWRAVLDSQPVIVIEATR